MSLLCDDLSKEGAIALVTGADAQPRCDGLDAVPVKLLLLTIAEDFGPQHVRRRPGRARAARQRVSVGQG